MKSHAFRRISGHNKNMTYIDTILAYSTTTITISSATGRVGDLAVFYDAGRSIPFQPSVVIPTGWTKINSASSYLDAHAFSFSYKILASGDLDTAITGMTAGNDYSHKRIVLFRSGAQITITAENKTLTSSIGTPSSHSVPEKSPRPYIVVAGTCGAANPGTTSLTGTWYDTTFNTTRTSFAYKIFNTTGAALTVACTDSGNHTHLSSCALMVS